MMAKTFTCASCKGTFKTAADTPEDLASEAEGIFGPLQDDDSYASVCEDCFAEFMEWYETEHSPKPEAP